jgi:hypothetical protein
MGIRVIRIGQFVPLAYKSTEFFMVLAITRVTLKAKPEHAVSLDGMLLTEK